MDAQPTVYVVDDDASIRELVTWLMRREGVAVAAYASAREFLDAYAPGSPGCLVLDLYLPGMSGLDLQRDLAARGIGIPVIFLSGRADVPKAVQAVKDGAIDFIEKPFDYKRMVALVRDGLARDAEARERRGKNAAAAARLATLTQREREVLDRVVDGKPNRLIAEELAISIKTVEAHRARLMEKLEVDSMAELMQVALQFREAKAP
jgi:two-component system response regulator TtrR